MPSSGFRSLGAVALLALLAGCAGMTLAHTPGEIPRDTHGRPIWALIEPTVPRPPNP